MDVRPSPGGISAWLDANGVGRPQVRNRTFPPDAHRQKKRAADCSATHLCSPDGPDQRSEDAGILFVADEAQLADAAALDHRHDIVDDDIARIEIGRASCRERVCQYV